MRHGIREVKEGKTLPWEEARGRLKALTDNPEASCLLSLPEVSRRLGLLIPSACGHLFAAVSFVVGQTSPLSGLHGQLVAAFVLGMPGVPPDPLELDRLVVA